jgi:DICT domain-containing protein
VPTPYALVSAVETPARAFKHELLRQTRLLEHAALDDPPAFVAAALQDERYLSPSTREVYAALARVGSRAVLHARGLQSWLAPGVTGVALDDDDPLVDEWVIVLPSPSAPVVFAATDLDEPCDSDSERCFLFAVSRDPEVVEACAQALEGYAHVRR